MTKTSSIAEAGALRAPPWHAAFLKLPRVLDAWTSTDGSYCIRSDKGKDTARGVITSSISCPPRSRLPQLIVVLLLTLLSHSGSVGSRDVLKASSRWGPFGGAPRPPARPYRRPPAADRFASAGISVSAAGSRGTQGQQEEGQQEEGRHPPHRGRDFASWASDALGAILRFLGCSTAAFSCLSAAINATCAALLLSSAWSCSLKATAATSFAYHGNNSNNNNNNNSSSGGRAVLSIERGRLWRLHAAARGLRRAVSSCFQRRSSSSNSYCGMSIEEQQHLGEKRWLPWVVTAQDKPMITKPKDEESDPAASATAAPADAFGSRGTFALEGEGGGVFEEALPVVREATEATGKEIPHLMWPSAACEASGWSPIVGNNNSKAAAAADTEAAAEAAAIDRLLQSYAQRPPLLQWVFYFGVAFLWAVEVYGLAALHGPLLGARPTATTAAAAAAGETSSSSNSSRSYEPAAATAHVMLLLTELLLGVSFLGCLLSEAAFIIGNKHRKRRNRKLQALLLLICCCFGIGLYGFYTTHASAAATAAAPAASPFPAAIGEQQEQQQQQPLLQPPLHEATAAAASEEETSFLDDEEEPNRDELSALEREAVSFLSLTDGATPSLMQQEQQQQPREGRYRMKHSPQDVLVKLTPTDRYTTLRPTKSSNSNSNSNARRWLATAAATSADEDEEEEPAPIRRLSASPWDSASGARYLRAADELGDEGVADDNSSSTDNSSSSSSSSSRLWSHVVTALGALASCIANAWGTFRLRAKNLLGALPICCVLLPLLLLRIAAAVVTLDLVRHEDALTQKRDSSQKNSLEWLVASVCLSSGQVLPFFLWVHLAREEGWITWVPLRGIDPLLLLHSAASVALYVHLRKGCFRVGRKSLLYSIACVYNTFDLVNP